ncbi:hypothetical protein EI94DRAFT_1720550 [Lactarius quietus]|nr:hypothetical protein EI94DRAFT_1720550 [Lactarius quietus]
MLALPAFLDMFTSPDLALRQPLTGAAFFPLYLSHYAMAVLVILPHTFILKLSLLPFVLWQAWRCAVGLTLSAGLALSLGIKSDERLNHWNLVYVIAVVVIALRSFEWAFTRTPLRRYEPFAEGQHTPVERPLTIPNVIFDSVDLLFNQRGIRWSWGSKSFLRTLPPPPSLPGLVFKLLLKLTLYDMALYTVRRIRPSIGAIAGDTFFDPHLDPSRAPRSRHSLRSAAVMYHIASLVGRVLLRQSAADWPALSARPWTATSIADFWSFRWHQGAEFISAGAFFILMGVGASLEHVWQYTTGMQVRGFWGWAWTMTWTLLWGTFMLDGWARHGIFGCDFMPSVPLGRPIVDGLLALITNN